MTGPCRLCGSEKTRPRFRRVRTLLRCDDCGAVFRPGEVKVEDLVKTYNEDYYLKTWPGSLGRFFRDFDPEEHHKPRFLIKQLGYLQYLAGGPGRLLDVGAANGVFVKLAKDRGWEAEGVELSPFAASFGARQFGVKIHAGVIHDLPAEPVFDVITLWDTLEHMADPRETIASCHARLKPDGVLAALTPDVGSLINHLVHAAAILPGIRKPLLDKLYHKDHLTFFDRESLPKALIDAGFTIHWIEGYDEDPRDTETGGALRLLVWVTRGLAWTMNREHEILVLARKSSGREPTRQI